MKLQLKRAYEKPSEGDGARYLVDRLWPRGVKKEALELTGWLKDAAPSDELRRWFHQDTSRWDEFRERYEKELRAHDEALHPLRDALSKGPVTLVYAAKDQDRNHALILREHLLKKSARQGSS